MGIVCKDSKILLKLRKAKEKFSDCKLIGMRPGLYGFRCHHFFCISRPLFEYNLINRTTYMRVVVMSYTVLLPILSRTNQTSLEMEY